MNISFLPGGESTASALAAERTRMEVVAQNIANAFATKAEGGLPYQRHQVVFENILSDRVGDNSALGAISSVKVSRIEKDNRAPILIHNPSHPHADPETGMVAYPAINMHEEMADMIVASRAFEANLAVVKNARQMALQTLSIGKR
jgi:flagellar basal-body rod protein FlgC